MSKRFLQRVSAVLMLCAMTAVFGGSAIAQRNRQDPNRRQSAEIFADRSESIFELVNRERRRRDTRMLIWNDELAAVARNYSRQMARENFFGHSDRRGRTLRDRLDAARIENWSGIGENLFYCEGYDDYAPVSIRGWLESSSHRKNMLNPSFSETGVGVASDGGGRIYVTQVFLRK